MRRALALSPILFFALSGCGNDSVTGSTAAAGCATAIACGLLGPNAGMSSCTTAAINTNNPLYAGAVGFTPKTVNCIAAAGSNCDNAKKCLNGGQTPSPCTGASQSCTGTVLNGCSSAAGSGGNNGSTKLDCGDLALMCVVNGSAGGCGVGTCATVGTSCAGTKIQSCNGGILTEIDCADYGATCVTGALGGAHCRGNGAACQTMLLGQDALGTPLRCDGNVLVHCTDSQESHFNCASLNQSCLSNANGATFGCALGGACNTNTFSATCAGLELSFCNDGKIATFNCGGHGFKSCSPDNGGSCSL